MEPFRDEDDLATTLRSLRPAPQATFAAELDERAAAGFPRRSPFGDSPLGRLGAQLRALPPRRLVLSGGATALAALAVATTIVAVNESDPTPPEVTSAHHRDNSNEAGVQFEAEAVHSIAVPAHFNAPAHFKASSAGGASSASEAASAPMSTGPYDASARLHRDIERAAQVVLGAKAADVNKDAAKVFEAVHAYHGIVLSSSIRDGGEGEGEAGAWFELLIPGTRVGDALAAISAIDEVHSRHQSTADITAPTVQIGERLQDSRAKIEGLLEQLAAADTDAERAATEAELRATRGQATSLRSQLATLRRRANLSRVSVRIETGDASSSSSGSGWGADDALGDAGHILGIAAGVAIVGLAVLAPIALIALLAWLASRVWRHRRRERILD